MIRGWDAWYFMDLHAGRHHAFDPARLGGDEQPGEAQRA